jgi:predicted RNase H-like HicB family nuclease
MRPMTTFTAAIHQEEGVYVAKCIETDTVSQGSTIEEALNNLREATKLYIEEFGFNGETHSIIKTFEVTGDAKT